MTCCLTQLQKRCTNTTVQIAQCYQHSANSIVLIRCFGANRNMSQNMRSLCYFLVENLCLCYFLRFFHLCDDDDDDDGGDQVRLGGSSHLIFQLAAASQHSQQQQQLVKHPQCT